jgi:transcriptional regulator with XRE-family HTH domain
MLVADIPCHPSSAHIEEKAKRQALGVHLPMTSDGLIKVSAKPLEVVGLIHGRKDVTSVNELAFEVGVSAPTIRKAMKGEIIRQTNAQKIADFFDVELGYICNEII